MRVPKYCRHANGQAYVYHRTIDRPGHRLYLGLYGTEESRKRYRQFLEQLEATRDQPQLDLSPIHERTVGEICVAYLLHAEQYYRAADGSLTTEFAGNKCAIERFLAMYASELAASISPKRLVAYQQRLAKQYSRRTVNQYVGRIKRMFRWASKQELIPPTVFAGLVCVDGLRAGRSDAVDRPDVPAVPWGDVELCLPYMSPVVCAMVRIQYLCGMRPGEVCGMRRVDIDMQDEIWIYSPAHHKNQWRGHTLVKAIPVAAQEILRDFFRPAADAYLFSPAESARWHFERRRKDAGQDRKTKAFPCEQRRLARQRRRTRLRIPRNRDHFSTSGYRQSIHYAIEQAQAAGVEVAKWSPNQLRHSIATTISQGLDHHAAQRWLGHRNMATTDVYVERQVAELIAIARQLDSQWAG